MDTLNPVGNYDPKVQSFLDNIDDDMSDSERAETIKLLKNLLKKRKCRKCQNSVFHLKSCEFCIRKYLEDNFTDWDSESRINELIQSCQKDTIRSDAVIEWIPFDNLKDIQYMAEGSFYKIYKAIWLEGRYISWDNDREKLKRFGPHSVTIKHINLNPDSDQWFREIKTHLTLSASISPIILSYGITLDPESNSYMIVMENVDSSLKSYLQDTVNIKKELSWIQKYRILLNISTSLESVHKNDLVYGDLHSGNIMYSNSEESWLIGDFGECRPAGTALSDVYGLLPYIAPEIFKSRRDQTTINLDKSLDIYSFGMIMWEISTTRQPFIEKRHDLGLTSEIINGSRPDVMAGTPPKYTKLMERCWNDDVSERPSIREIQDEIRSILSDYNKEKMDPAEMEIMKQVHFYEARIEFLPFRGGIDVDARPNPGQTETNAITIEIISPDKIRNETMSDGIGLISYATLSSSKGIKEIAIKSLKIERSNKSKSETFLAVLRQKLTEMGVLSHPNVIEFLGIGIKDEDRLFFVMPRANEGNLRNYYNKYKGLPFDDKIEIAKGIAKGIMILHERNIIHENLNPDNILMSNETPQISGLPLPYKNMEFYFKNKEYYFDDTLFGNIGFVDPDYFLCKKPKRERPVDVYSFGSLLWEILSERIPYLNYDNLFELVSNIKSGSLREPVEFENDKINNLIINCWDKDRSKRDTIHNVYNILDKNLP